MSGCSYRSSQLSHEKLVGPLHLLISELDNENDEDVLPLNTLQQHKSFQQLINEADRVAVGNSNSTNAEIFEQETLTLEPNVVILSNAEILEQETLTSEPNVVILSNAEILEQEILTSEPNVVILSNAEILEQEKLTAEPNVVILSNVEILEQETLASEPNVVILSNAEILEQETLISEPKVEILSNYLLNQQVIKKPVKINEVVVKNRKRPISRRVVKSEGIKQVQKHKINDKNEKEKNKIQINVHISDRVVPVRAIASLPKQLHIRRNVILARRALPQRVRFGPVEGVICKLFPCEVDELLFEAGVNHKPLFLMRKDEESVTHINVTDKDKSNWLSLLPLGDENTANVWLYEEDNEIYGITIKTIFSRTPLALGYSKKYADGHNMPQDSPILDLEEEQLKWWCFECELSLGSAARLHRHKTVYHKTKKPSRRKYPCLYCLQLFSSLNALLRHKTLTCKKKPGKLCASTVESVSTETLPGSSTPLITEEIKTPSDESFVNYNSLDLSTNLFDPDRICNINLDTSGSLKSDIEFNLYSDSGVLKFESLDNNDEFHYNDKSDNQNATKNDELIMVFCGHCQQTMTKAKKRLHLRECPARQFQCECGKIFRKKENLAEHVYSEHTSKIKEEPKKESKDLPYKCDICGLQFKRRGILINHLWRVHKKTSPAVPLERRVLHYPCSACPKIYRSPAKRKIHMKRHHPGESFLVPPIEGELRVCKPAQCQGCPRQYSDRNKLLQHIRAKHPELANEIRDHKSTTNATSKQQSES